jgi:hypothetical protein
MASRLDRAEALCWLFYLRPSTAYWLYAFSQRHFELNLLAWRSMIQDVFDTLRAVLTLSISWSAESRQGEQV